MFCRRLIPAAICKAILVATAVSISACSESDSRQFASAGIDPGAAAAWEQNIVRPGVYYDP
jgi:hypothetical protein